MGIGQKMSDNKGEQEEMETWGEASLRPWDSEETPGLEEEA